AGAKVVFPDGTGVGVGWRAQLYFVPLGVPLAQLYPIPVTSVFKTTYEASLGYVKPITVGVPTFPGEDQPRASGEKVTVVMRAFTELTFEAATEYGESNPITVVLGGGDRKPVTLAALEGFTVMMNSVTSVATAGFVPGDVVAVKLAAKPTSRVKTYSVQDWVPTGWTVIQVSDGGVFDPASGQVSWGAFSDNQARELRYQVRSAPDSPDRVRFEGESNFDALTYPIGGTRQLLASSRLLVTQRSPNGEVQLRLNGRPGASYTVSASSDLIRWTPLGVMAELNGSWQFTDKGAAGETVRFYRASTP
ncbi:MAG: hypothetical protein HY735_01405, partial [Verrucomicrobia bacterium]|nr:hypothetical protein [Verrucomicrobiota bacterium]